MRREQERKVLAKLVDLISKIGDFEQIHDDVFFWDEKTDEFINTCTDKRVKLTPEDIKNLTKLKHITIENLNKFLQPLIIAREEAQIEQEKQSRKERKVMQNEYFNQKYKEFYEQEPQEN